MKFLKVAILFFGALTLIGFIFSAYAHAEPEYGNVEISRVVSVYDGDTVTVDVDGWPAVAGTKISVRVRGIDTPEIKGKCVQEKVLAVKAKDVMLSTLSTAHVVELRRIGRDKYFRLLAEVWADSVNVADILRSEGLARLYDGGTKLGWCEAV